MIKAEWWSVYIKNIRIKLYDTVQSLQWRHNDHSGASNHRLHDCLINRLFTHRSKKTSKFRVTGLCEGASVTDEFPAQRASNAENVSIWWRDHGPWVGQRANFIIRCRQGTWWLKNDLWYFSFFHMKIPLMIFHKSCSRTVWNEMNYFELSVLTDTNS